MTIPYSPIAVNTGSKLVVIDTGTGEANFEKTKGVSGQFHGNLKASGINRDNVDIVIISHFHGDHINGLLRPTISRRLRMRRSSCRQQSGNISWTMLKWANRPPSA